MVPLVPKRGCSQHQSMTTLRNITLDYPAGGGILRELLQNADDAGSSSLEFILDPRHHPTSPLVHPGLAEFQGPSLLAHNDSVFSPSDFESLSRVGNSHKFFDCNSTGKYGRGFNSVFNWTDSPSVLSGTSLLILNPHLSWSADLGPISVCGPMYDFGEQFGEQEMRNQLAAFGAVLEDFGTRFGGTIIRLPLRTKEQAFKSAIVHDEKFTSQEDIISAFSKFKDEMVESLLFLKNVNSITLRIAGQAGVYAKVEILGKEAVASCKASLAVAFQEVFQNRSSEHFDTSFSVAIRYYDLGQDERVLDWVISHHLRRRFDGDDDLASWGETQKLIPWVAIAALVRVIECGQEQGITSVGRLFTILPLPIYTHQPVHIHGMFSLTTDRASIHQVRDLTVQENSDPCRGSYWNSMLFEESLAFAWPWFLHELARRSADATFTDGFRYWPRKFDQNHFSGTWLLFLRKFLEVIVDNDLSIWPTGQGLLAAGEVYLGRQQREEIRVNVKRYSTLVLSELCALEDVGMPITLPPDELYDSTEKLFEEVGARILTPITAALFLRTVPEKLCLASENVKQRLLDYLLTAPGYAHLNGIKLFPMCDGSFAASGALSPTILMLPIDERERDLFTLQPHMTIDIKKLESKIYARLRADMVAVEKETSLKRWAMEDLYDYCMETYFWGLNPSTAPDILQVTDICSLGSNFPENLRDLWEWIISQVPKESDVEGFLGLVGNLWLIPILGEKYRRLKPVNRQPLIDPSSWMELGSFLKSVCNTKEDAYSTNLLYSSGSVNISATEFLRANKFIQSCRDFGAFMDWLDYRSDFVSLFYSKERNELVQYLEVLACDLLKSETAPTRTPRLLKQLKKLPVFEEISNNSEGTCLNWTTLNNRRVSKYVAVTMKSVVPSINGIIFINARNSSAVELVRILGLAEVPSMSQLLGEYVLPALSAETVPNIVERLGIFALDNFSSLSSKNIVRLAGMRFVPVKSSTNCGIVAKSLKSPGECVDPRSGLGNLFFAHEMVWIGVDFWKAYSEKLSRLGLMNTITIELVLDRVRAYRNVMEHIGKNEMFKRVKALIFASTQLDIPVLNASEGRPWLPARLPNRGEFLVVRPKDCRDESFQALVGYSMPIVPFTVGCNWRKALGWNTLIPPIALRKQLEVVVARKEFLTLGAILDYLTKNCQFQGYLDCLGDFKWVPGVSGDAFRPSDLFFDHATKLSPWRDCIANGLREKYRPLFIRFGVEEQPGILQLKQFINSYARGTPLSQTDLDLVINAVLLATELYPDGEFAGFSVPDNTGVLHDFSVLTAGAPQYCEAEIFFLHPRVSQQTIKVLGIPTLDQRQLEDVTEMNFCLKTEYAQTGTRETVIRNTMMHYSIESTFNEYLANAEDSGTATKIGWILDKTQDWDKTNLMTEELGEAMGPGLLCWNDGVFADKDFSGLVDIGRGSKGNELESSGRFGSGALTMYHWTSLPQIISGEFFVIFDPEEKYLPLNRHTKHRHAGMKISLQKMQKHYPGHLRPFYGILDFSPASNRLEGTIFRFPFRTPNCGSSLILNNRIIDVWDAFEFIQEYFIDAKRSLLFLTRVTTVEFRVKGSESIEWKVTTTRGPGEGKILGGFIEQLFVESRQLSPSQVQSITNDEWILAHRDVPEALIPKALRKTRDEHKLRTRCGIAALVSHRYSCLEFDGRYFMVLPFRWPSVLPVHIHASFIVTGDRNMISLAKGTKESGSGWNLWILEYGVVELYLDFLQYLARYLGRFALKFWPPHQAVSDPLSDKLGRKFWEKVPGSDLKLFTIEKRTSILGIGPFGIRRERNQRNLAMKEVIFDFLEPRESELLRTVLEKLNMQNIICPTGVISEALQQLGLEQVSRIDPPYIRDLLRRNQGKNVLQTIWEADNYSFCRLGPLLEFMLKKSECLSNTIKGCQILPLANQTLGILDQPGDRSTCKYYIAQKGTMDLFDYAPRLIVHPDVSQTMVGILLKLDLNVSILPFSDLPRLFADVTEVEKVSPKFHCFLRKFWVSIQYEYESQPHYNPSVLSKLPIHSALVSGQLRAISPDEFQSLPAIVSPDDASETRLCSKLPGLYLIDRHTISSAMRKVEKLRGPVGLMRFIEALGKLAKSRHKIPETYLLLFLEPGDIMLLRRLLKDVVSGQVLRNHPIAVPILKALPLWPTMDGRLVNALDALLAPDPRFCAPWIEGQKYFIGPEASQEFALVLQLIEVRKIEAPKFIADYCQRNIGQQLKPAETSHYRIFMEAYVHYIGKLPPNSPLLLDGNCHLRPSRELYDHNESVFMAAFRESEKDHFLHPNFRYLKDWCTPGLRSVVSGTHYHECAIHISKRAILRGSWLPLEVDAATVFAYLRYQEDFILQHWSDEELRRLRGVQFVPIFRRLPTQPRHRRGRMNIISSMRAFRSLDDCITADYLEVCWSQCPIYAQPPGKYILQQIPSKGVPSTQIVFRHIEYLAVHRNELRCVEDIQLYIKDLMASYKFLNNYYSLPEHGMEKVRDIDHRILDIVIWLNVGEPITGTTINLFETSWASAKDLCLGIEYDFGRYRFVRSMLAGFEKLLNALEVEEVRKPKLETTTSDEYQFKATYERFYSFFQEGKLCDVELNVDGTVFKAHRVILASESSYWEKMFTGDWREAGERKVTIKETASHTVSAMLHFSYTGLLPPMSSDLDASECLDRMVDWLVAADQWNMLAFKAHIEEMVIRQDYVRPENVRQVLGIAREAHAKKLSRCCEVYIEENRKVMEKLDYSVA